MRFFVFERRFSHAFPVNNVALLKHLAFKRGLTIDHRHYNEYGYRNNVGIIFSG